jgi:hypothetical protein
MKKIDMVGIESGRLTVISEACETKGGRVTWLCKCLCGNMINVTGKQIRSGRTKSCGCLRKDTIRSISETHGHSKTRTYKIWTGMIQRCTNDKVKCYDRYGGSGVLVCDRWLSSFDSFLFDMGHAPQGMQIDRINYMGNYEPSNCKWSSRIEQARNKKNNRIIELSGEKLCVAEWADRLDVHPDRIHNRLRKGWDEERAITEPVIKITQSQRGTGGFGSTGK